MAETSRESGFGHFDADVYAAAQEEPTLILGGLLYRGRLLDIEEWFGYAEQLEQLRSRDAAATARARENLERAGGDLPALPAIAGVHPREYKAFYHRYLRAVFPRRRYRWWAPDPVKGLLAMPWGVVMEATESFFVLQARATKPRGGRLSATPGTSSPPSTPAPALLDAPLP